MNDGLIPRRYAKALYKFALENGDNEQIYELLKPLSKGLRGLDDLKRVLINPHIPAEDKGKVMMQLVGARPGSSLDKFILLVIRNNRADFLRKIALAYVQLYREEHSIAEVIITSAVELSNDKINRIVEAARQQLGQVALEVETQVDPELIGGFTVKMGDVFLDASVKSELNQLRLKLIS